ncbi:MAG: helix-turn-helix transcriptional regulator [Alphaproteobacteria bacterium]|nr:helix-turn-helix transcriptional regulator [Alphaproteobacteria bacterium]
MHVDTLSPTLAALSDPTRRAILARLARGEATVTELTAPLAISMPAVSRHLKVLEQAGLIERGRDAQFRPCRLRPEGLQEVRSWIDELRALWEQRLDRLETYLAELQAGLPASAPAPEDPDDDGR